MRRAVAAQETNPVSFGQKEPRHSDPATALYKHRFFEPWPTEAWQYVVIVLLFVLGGAGSLIKLLGPLLGGLAAAGTVALSVAAVVLLFKKATRIRSPSEDLTHIVLAGVAPQFAEACAELAEQDADRIGSALQQMADGFQSQS